jgi:hypothetical protein
MEQEGTRREKVKGSCGTVGKSADETIEPKASGPF